MKNQFKQTAYAVAVATLYGLSAGQASATVTFNSDASINFSVAAISGSSSDYSDLLMSGSFVRSGVDFPLVYSDTTGDAVVDDHNPEIPYFDAAVAEGASFEHSFAFRGLVGDGTIDLEQVGWYDLAFENFGGESFDITLNFAYDLSTEVVGQFGTVGIDLAFRDLDDPDNEFGYSVLASSEFADLAEDGIANSESFTFTLDPYGYKGFQADVYHWGSLQAAPVPLPAAVWPFLTGLLGIFGLRKGKRVGA